MHKDASYWVNKLELAPHPEGGSYRQTYRSDLLLPAHALPAQFAGPRAVATSIFFLLAENDFSAFHRLHSDELWHFHVGAALLIHLIAPDGTYSVIRLGDDPESGDVLQAVVKAETWFASHLAPHSRGPRESGPGNRFALVGCTVAPGFDFADFELANRADLSRHYPQHSALIGKLTRS